MKQWCTIIKAVSPLDGTIKNYAGPYVQGNTEQQARNYCEAHGLGYCHIDGELVIELDVGIFLN